MTLKLTNIEAKPAKTSVTSFFTQSPSFLQHQRLMKPKKGKDNAQHGGWIWSGDPTIPHRQSLFGLEEIPCDNQITLLLR